MILLANDYYKILKFKNRGRGVVALKHIPAGTVIGDYLGRVVSDKEADALEGKYGCYSFEYYGKNTSLFPLDLKAVGAHLFNHSCSANCGPIDYQGHNLLFTLRHIFPGEELTLDYAFDPKLGGGIGACYCDSPFCRGTMHARLDPPRLNKKKILKSPKDRKFKIYKIGEFVPPLEKYPKEIKDNKDEYNIFANLKAKPLDVPGNKLLSKNELRQMIRLSGRIVRFPALKLSILAVTSDYLITEL